MGKKAISENYRLKAANLRTKASKNNARSAASNHLPKIDIVGTRIESETNQYGFEGIDIQGLDVECPMKHKGMFMVSSGVFLFFRWSSKF